MKCISPVFLFFILFACETPAFDGDKRQIQAKDYIRSQLKRNRTLAITGFKEDTLELPAEPLNKRPIRYTIEFNFKDSSGTTIHKKAAVHFTPDGHSITRAEIIDAP